MYLCFIFEAALLCHVFLLQLKNHIRLEKEAYSNTRSLEI